MNYTGANKKRLPLTEKRQVLKSGIMNSAQQGTIEVPNEVKKVLMEHLESEMTDEEPDEQMLEVLEDIYVKAGEIGILLILLISKLYYKNFIKSYIIPA